MIRLYHYDFCLELGVLPPGLRGLPTSRSLSPERGSRYLYLPGTLEQVRAYHLSQGEHRKSGCCTLYFPSEGALERFFQQYRLTFESVLAAGAVVMEAQGHLLFIWRRGKWDLPKGKVEPTESPQEAAARELAEETGLSCGAAERFLTRTYHLYSEGEKTFLKEVQWYLFRCAAKSPPVQVQVEEGIQNYKWVPPAEVPFLYPHSYGTIRDVIEYVLEHVLSAPSR